MKSSNESFNDSWDDSLGVSLEGAVRRPWPVAPGQGQLEAGGRRAAAGMAAGQPAGWPPGSPRAECCGNQPFEFFVVVFSCSCQKKFSDKLTKTKNDNSNNNSNNDGSGSKTNFLLSVSSAQG